MTTIPTTPDLDGVKRIREALKRGTEDESHHWRYPCSHEWRLENERDNILESGELLEEALGELWSVMTPEQTQDLRQLLLNAVSGNHGAAGLQLALLLQTAAERYAVELVDR